MTHHQQSSPSPPHEYSYDPHRESPSMEIVRVLAVLNNVEPTDLPTLATAVDLDALDTLVRPRERGQRPPSPVHVEFTYADRDVVVTSDGTIRVGDAD